MIKQHILLLATLICLCPHLAAKTAEEDTVVKELTAWNPDGKHGWRAVIKNNRMSLETVQRHEYHPRLKVRRLAYSKGVEFYGKTRFGEVILNISGKPCRDNNGNSNEFSATLHYRGKISKGCAARGAYDHAPT